MKGNVIYNLINNLLPWLEETAVSPILIESSKHPRIALSSKYEQVHLNYEEANYG